jgi:hypothetical protein
MRRYVIDAPTEASAPKAHERMTEIKMRLLGDRVSRLQADGLVTVDLPPEMGAA